MKRFLTILAAIAIYWAASGMASAVEITLQFDPNDIFNYATSDDTRLNQLGTARLLEVYPNGHPNPRSRYYETYNDGSAGRDTDATPAQDIQSVQNIMEYIATGGYQGMSSVQLWLRGGVGSTWGESVVEKSPDVIPSANGEYDWTTGVSEGSATFNTALGGEGHQNAISPDFHPATHLFSVTGDLFVDNNLNSVFDEGVDSDLVVGQQYTLWVAAVFNNWHTVDDYGNDWWGSVDLQGSVVATATPEPSTLVLLALAGLTGLAVAWIRRRKA